MAEVGSVLYRDTRAVLSLLFEDSHSNLVISKLRGNRAHLMSSLTWAETHAVIERMRRTGAVADALITAAYEKLGSFEWHRVAAVPDWSLSRQLAARWRLRGADLWHLVAAKTLQRDLPELGLLTYDAELREAALGEGLIPLDR